METIPEYDSANCADALGTSHNQLCACLTLSSNPSPLATCHSWDKTSLSLPVANWQCLWVVRTIDNACKSTQGFNNWENMSSNSGTSNQLFDDRCHPRRVCVGISGTQVQQIKGKWYCAFGQCRQLLANTWGMSTRVKLPVIPPLTNPLNSVRASNARPDPQYLNT